MNIVGTYEMLSWIQSIFDELVPNQHFRCSSVRKQKNFYCYVITGKRAECLLKVLLNSVSYGLKRKWHKVNMKVDDR